MTPAAALERLRHLPFEDLPFARIDHHRALRQGHPEVVFCEGKTSGAGRSHLRAAGGRSAVFLGTRATEAHGRARCRARFPGRSWNPAGPHRVTCPRPSRAASGSDRAPFWWSRPAPAICRWRRRRRSWRRCSGTTVERLVDVGVAGLHRLLAASEQLQRARVVIVVAGMEGALPSVVGGHGGGAGDRGADQRRVRSVVRRAGGAAGMLNSCAAGVTVVNIDNGFGAAAAASRICRAMTVRTVVASSDPPFVWLDVVQPDPERAGDDRPAL